jgi:cytidylate kinase
MIIQQARSVKIVAISRSTDLTQTPNMVNLMRLIGRLLPQPGAHIFWLFLDHPSASPSSNHVLDQASSTALMKEIQATIKRQTDGIRALFERLVMQGRQDLGPVKMSSLIHQQMVSVSLRASADAGRIEDFDPTSKW